MKKFIAILISLVIIFIKSPSQAEVFTRPGQGIFASICILNIYHYLSRVVAISPGDYYFGGYDMNAKGLTVLMVEPGKHPKVSPRAPKRQSKGCLFFCLQGTGFPSLSLPKQLIPLEIQRVWISRGIFRSLCAICNHFYPFPSVWLSGGRQEYVLVAKLFGTNILVIR